MPFLLLRFPPPPPDACAPVCRFVASSSLTATLMAVSKISSTPFISLLLHSMYRAFMRAATDWPCSEVTGVSPCVFSRSIQVRLLRRSDLRPRSMMGVVGQKCRTSGYHCDQVSEVS